MNPRTHLVALVAMHGVAPFDLSGAAQLFGAACTENGVPLYHLVVCGEAPIVHGMGFDVKPDCGFEALESADTVIVAGSNNFDRPIPRDLISALRKASRAGARVCSICYGAFVLAAAGLLDARRAVTHRMGIDALARRYPAILIEREAMVVDDGSIVTSAGALAGIEMCLGLIRRDFGEALAARAEWVAMGRAPADAASQTVPPLPETGIGAVLHWMSAHYAEPLTVPLLASRAKLSERSFARHFRAQMGTSPHQWLLARRVHKARALLETTTQSIAQIAVLTGFESTNAFRAKFQSLLGKSPSHYRRGILAGRENSRAM